MTQARVRKALETKLSTFAAAQSLSVAWPNVEFTPPAGVYLRAFILPAATISPDIQRIGRKYEGLFQVDIVGVVGDGYSATGAIFEAMASAFDPAVSLTADGLRVFLLEPFSSAAPLQSGDRYTVPCSIPYRADSY